MINSISTTNRDVIVIFKAKYDHNGAFLPFFHPIQTLRLHAQSKYKILYRDMGAIEDLPDQIAQLKSQQNRIHGIWIKAHGCSTGITLSKTQQVTIKTARVWKEALNQIEKNAQIIIDSCSTAKIKNPKIPSFAQVIANLSSGREVVAATEDVSGFGSHFNWKAGRMNVKFLDAKKTKHTGIIGKIMNFIYEFLFCYSFGHYGRSITKRFGATAVAA